MQTLPTSRQPSQRALHTPCSACPRPVTLLSHGPSLEQEWRQVSTQRWRQRASAGSQARRMATTPQCSSTPSRSLLTRRQVAAMEPAWQPAQQALKPRLCLYSADIQPGSLRTKGARAQGGHLQQPHGYSQETLASRSVCKKQRKGLRLRVCKPYVFMGLPAARRRRCCARRPRRHR